MELQSGYESINKYHGGFVGVNISVVIVAASLVLLSGCASAPKSIYEWGGYQSTLLSHTKNPSEKQKYADRLSATVAKSEEKNAVPPGLYAEYGYALLSLDRTAEALEYFAKERSKWPESAKLMDGVIGRLTRARAEPAAVPAAPEIGDGRSNAQQVPVPAMQPAASVDSPSDLPKDR